MGTGKPLTAPVTAADAPGRFSAYVAEFAVALDGPRRRRAAIVAEVLDGLGEAADRHRARGVNNQHAIAAAIEEFGPPAALAEGFSHELATARARQTVSVLLFTGPLVGIWWLLLLVPTPWQQDPIQIWAAIPVLPLVAAAVLFGIALIASTGSLTRWLPETAPTRALAASTTLGLGCIAIDLAALITLAGHAISGQPAQPPTLAAAAVAASIARIAYTTRTLRANCRDHRAVREKNPTSHHR